MDGSCIAYSGSSQTGGPGVWPTVQPKKKKTKTKATKQSFSASCICHDCDDFASLPPPDSHMLTMDKAVPSCGLNFTQGLHPRSLGQKMGWREWHDGLAFRSTTLYHQSMDHGTARSQESQIDVKQTACDSACVIVLAQLRYGTCVVLGALGAWPELEGIRGVFR